MMTPLFAITHGAAVADTALRQAMDDWYRPRGRRRFGRLAVRRTADRRN